MPTSRIDPIRGEAASVNGGLSVVVCSWKRPERLRRCLKGLSDQSVLPREILVVGVEGDADTAHAVDDLGSQGLTTRVVWQRGRAGLGNARNLGWSSARGEWVAFIDDDAIADPRWIESIAKHFQDGTTALAGQVRDPEDGRIISDGSFRFWLRDLHLCPAGCNMAFRKSWLEAVGGFDENLAYGFDDHDIGIKLTLSGVRVTDAPEAIVWHRRSWGPARETLGPNLPQYAWSGAYLIARHAGSLGVSKAEYFARFCALLIELIAMSRSPRSDRGRFRARGPRSLVRTTWSVSRSSFLGTLFGWRAAKTSSRPARQ